MIKLWRVRLSQPNCYHAVGRYYTFFEALAAAKEYACAGLGWSVEIY